jgi:non-ribosomal peptide synthase protein (TIGR01720 family)
VAVVVREDQPGTKHIVAYVVAPSTDGLRELAAETLPDYMVPSAFVTIDRIPTTPNGKLDRKALPAPDFGAAAGGRVAETEAEQLICDLFAQVLRVPAVGADDNFFDLGGDSILSIQLVSRAKEAGLVFTPREVFTYKSPAALAAVARAEQAVVEEEGAGVGELTLLPIARWLLEEGGEIDGFHQSMVVGIPEDIEEFELVDALQTLLDHHDALRMRLSDGRAEILEPGAVNAADCLDGVGMVKAEWTPGQVKLILHHLVVDAVSWQILVPDFLDVVQGRKLAPVGTSYRQWGQKLAERAMDPTVAHELPLWTEILQEPDLRLGSRPLDDTAGTAKTLTMSVPVDLSGVQAAFHAGMNDVLLTALALAVASWRGSDGPVLVDLEGHGRDELPGTDLSRTVGWFTSQYPVRLDTGVTDWQELWAAGPTAGTALKRVKEHLRGVEGLNFGLLRYLNGRTAPVLAALPKPQIGFNYLGRLDSPDGIGGGGDDGMRLPHVLEITAFTDGPALTVTWLWPGELLSEKDVRELAETWFRALQVLVDHAERPDAGGYTPSDLHLVELSQDEIDEFEADWEMSK